MTRKHHRHNGDSVKSMGLKNSTNGSRTHSGFGTIGRVLFPISAPRVERQAKLSTAVRAAVADMKK